MISTNYNFLFVHIPKTAGNSIQNVLRAYSEDRIVIVAPHQDGIERFEVRSDRYNIHKHSTLQNYLDELGEDVLNNLFKFTTVRNPWDRMVSFYFSPHRGRVVWNRGEFIQFVEQIPPITEHVALRNQGQSGDECFKNMDFFIRYEQLDEDFKKACELIGIPCQRLPRRNQSERQKYAVYYDTDLVELVGNRFRDEIRFFGYEFERDG
jgi:hypothetical protein